MVHESGSKHVVNDRGYVVKYVTHRSHDDVKSFFQITVHGPASRGTPQAHQYLFDWNHAPADKLIREGRFLTDSTTRMPGSKRFAGGPLG